MSTDEWLVANINMTGFYRVNYDSGNWDRLLATLNDNHQVGNLVDDAAWRWRLVLFHLPHQLFYFFRRFQWSTEPRLSTMPLTWRGETFFSRSIVVSHWKHRYLTVLFYSQGWASEHNSGAEHHQVPRQGGGVHALGDCHTQFELLLPHVWPQWSERTHAGQWWRFNSCWTSSVVQCNVLWEMLVKWYWWVSFRWLDHEKLPNFILQAYLRKQVTPLFNHFKEVTGNWTKIPEGHTDQ